MPDNYFLAKDDRSRTCTKCKQEITAETYSMAIQRAFMGVMGSKMFSHLQCSSKSVVNFLINNKFKDLKGFEELSSGESDSVKQVLEDVADGVLKALTKNKKKRKTPTKKAKKEDKPPTKKPRSPPASKSASAFYIRDEVQKRKEEDPSINVKELKKELASDWEALDEDTKTEYIAKEEHDLVRFETAYAKYQVKLEQWNAIEEAKEAAKQEAVEEDEATEEDEVDNNDENTVPTVAVEG